MITESTITIDAPAPLVWSVFTDTARWPEWTASVTELTPLDGEDIEVGHRFRIRQPRFPVLVWEVTAVDPGRSWTWRQRSPGGTTFATHEVTPVDDSRTHVRQVIDQRGPIGSLVGRLARGLTRRYLQMEADGLRARSEEAHRRGAAH